MRRVTWFKHFRPNNHLIMNKESRGNVSERRKGGRLAVLGRTRLLKEILGSESRMNCLDVAAQSLQFVNEAVSFTDIEQNRFLYVNPAWVRLYGYSIRQVMGETVAPLIYMPDISKRTLHTIKAQTCNGGWEGCLLNRNSKGDVFMVSLRTGSLTDSDGELLVMLGVAVPIENTIGNGKGASSKTGKRQGKPKKGLSLEELRQLTPRELEIFTLFGRGLSSKQVAAKLGISAYTVQTHRNHLKKKLGATSTSELNFLSYQWVSNGVEGPG